MFSFSIVSIPSEDTRTRLTCQTPRLRGSSVLLMRSYLGVMPLAVRSRLHRLVMPPAGLPGVAVMPCHSSPSSNPPWAPVQGGLQPLRSSVLPGLSPGRTRVRVGVVVAARLRANRSELPGQRVT
jgi:hypothetical protein